MLFNLKNGAGLASLLVFSSIMMLVVVTIEADSRCRLPSRPWTTENFKDIFREECIFNEYLTEYRYAEGKDLWIPPSPKAKQIWRTIFVRHIQYLLLKSQCRLNYEPLPVEIKDDIYGLYPEMRYLPGDADIIKRYRAIFKKDSEPKEGKWNIDLMRGRLIIMAHRQARLSKDCNISKIYINKYTDRTCDEQQGLGVGLFCTLNDWQPPQIELKSSDSDDC